MKMTSEQFDRYAKDPGGSDDYVRQLFHLPADQYFTVSVWPEAGLVRVNRNLFRTVRAVKVSKSDQ
jgi:hypothetical protein